MIWLILRQFWCSSHSFVSFISVGARNSCHENSLNLVNFPVVDDLRQVAHTLCRAVSCLLCTESRMDFIGWCVLVFFLLEYVKGPEDKEQVPVVCSLNLPLLVFSPSRSLILLIQIFSLLDNFAQPSLLRDHGTPFGGTSAKVSASQRKRGTHKRQISKLPTPYPPVSISANNHNRQSQRLG